jgi:hypothetical protein
MAAYLLVRAQVHDRARRGDFDHWYQTKHLPEAKAAFDAISAWRGWSPIDANLHYAFYEFSSAKEAVAVLNSDAIRALIAEFDDTWGESVSRTREVIERIQSLQD